MAAGLGFKTFTTGEVLTAADTNGYLMQGVLVFASSAARAAAITSPQEGQMTFLKDTNSTEYYDGSAYQSVSTTGGQTLISTTTLSGASVTLSSIPGTYNDLRLVISNYLPATDGSSLRMQVNADTNTRYQGIVSNTAGSPAAAFGATQWTLTGGADNVVTTNIAVMDIPSYAKSTIMKIAECYALTADSTTSTSVTLLQTRFAYNQTTAITSLVLFPNSGNFTSGTVQLYGVK